ncbi:hypothetical protein GCM10028787_19520 [Brachybacterium horti]
MTALPPAPAPAAAPAAEPRHRLDPPRHLTPDPRRDRPWRTASVLLGSLIVLLVLVLLAASVLIPWYLDRNMTTVASTQELGSPTALSLEADVGDVTVVREADAQQVTLSLVESGATTPPPAGETVLARFTDSGTAQHPAISVRQPSGGNPVPWLDDTRDLLLVVPEDFDLDLDIQLDYGDVEAQGSFSALDVQADTGAVDLQDLTVNGPLTVATDFGDVSVDLAAPVTSGVDITSDTGEVDLGLAPDAAGDVRIAADLGSVTVRAPGTARRTVDAVTDLGETRVDPLITGADGDIVGHIAVESSSGDVIVTR